VSEFDTKEEPQSWTPAYIFRHLEVSFRKFTDELLLALVQSENRPEQTNASLTDIGDELRHILYHIYDAGYYSHPRELDPTKESKT